MTCRYLSGNELTGLPLGALENLAALSELYCFFFFGLRNSIFSCLLECAIKQASELDCVVDYFHMVLPFRDFGQNNLTELPPGIFDSLVALNDL